MRIPSLHSSSAAIAAITLACSAAAQNVQLYGTVDAAVGSMAVQPPGAPNAAIVKTTGVFSGGLQTSYFGMKGEEDLGDGLRALFLLESFFRVDTGQVGRFDSNPSSEADYMWSREAFVGLGGKFGEIHLGNNVNPAWISMLLTNSMGTNSTFSPNFRQLYNGGTRGISEVDTATVNSVRYASPSLGGLDFSVNISPSEGRGDTTYALNTIYKAGPLLLTAAAQHVGYAAAPATTTLLTAPSVPLDTHRNQDMVLLGGAYSIGPVRAFGQYVQVKNKRTGTTDKLPSLGVSARFGAGELQLAYGQDKTSGTTDAKRTTTSAGYVYSLSKRTDLYTFAMADKVSVGTANSFMVGMRHRF